jgi:hypothetical protein
MNLEEAKKIITEAREIAAKLRAKAHIEKMKIINPDVEEDEALQSELEEAYTNPKAYLAKRKMNSDKAKGKAIPGVSGGKK